MRRLLSTDTMAVDLMRMDRGIKEDGSKGTGMDKGRKYSCTEAATMEDGNMIIDMTMEDSQTRPDHTILEDGIGIRCMESTSTTTKKANYSKRSIFQ